MKDKVSENVLAERGKVNSLGSFLLFIDRAEKKNMQQALNKIIRPLEDATQMHATLLKMVAVFRKTYVKRVRRCFNPPIVIKDAD